MCKDVLISCANLSFQVNIRVRLTEVSSLQEVTLIKLVGSLVLNWSSVFEVTVHLVPQQTHTEEHTPSCHQDGGEGLHFRPSSGYRWTLPQVCECVCKRELRLPPWQPVRGKIILTNWINILCVTGCWWRVRLPTHTHTGLLVCLATVCVCVWAQPKGR